MRWRTRIIIIIFILAIIIGMRWSGLTEVFTLEALKRYRLLLQQWVADYYVTSVLLYITLYIVAVLLVLPIPALMTMAGGFLFGTLLGALYANIGATTGAIGVFLWVRYIVGNALQERYYKQLQRFNNAVHAYGANFLLAVRLVALFPFFIINILAGLTQISLWTFVWTTSIGIFPGALVYAYAGQQLTLIEHIRDVFSWNVLLAFLLLALLALIPMFIIPLVRGKK